MNKHKANETIHDVMLRASNVPMIDEFYTQRTDDYEWMFAGLPDSGQTGSFYTMNTWVSDINGYIYRVVVSDVPKRVCRQILALDPTDIDAIYVEGDKPTDDECPNEVNRMAFYFDEYGTGGHLPDIDKPDPDDPNPDNPDPDNPDPDQPECTPACGSCEECVNGSCQVKTCEIESCPEGQTSTGTDACGCIIDCACSLSCTEPCTQLNKTTCSCDTIPECQCPSSPTCLPCQTLDYDEYMVGLFSFYVMVNGVVLLTDGLLIMRTLVVYVVVKKSEFIPAV